MATGVVSSKLGPVRTGGFRLVAAGKYEAMEWAMRERTFQAAAVAFLLGLAISLAWAFLQASGL